MYEKLKNMLCEELEKIVRKGELSAGSLDVVDKLTHALKSVETIMAMHEYDEGQSYGSPYRGGRTHHDNTPMTYMHDSMSYARGRGRGTKRDSMGRYSSNYSYDNAKEGLISELHRLKEDAPDETTKREFEKFIEKMQEN